MARAAADKAYKSFINGLVTEATGLTFPEDALSDADNVDIEFDGTVRRRFGLAWEGCGKLQHSDNNEASLARRAVEIHQWPSPGGVADRHFVVLRYGLRLYIFDGADEPLLCAGGLNGVTPLGQVQISHAAATPQVDTIETAGAGSINVPAGYNRLTIRAWGGGAGGQTAGSGGGGGAGVKKSINLAVADVGAAINYVNGSAGPIDGNGGSTTVTATLSLASLALSAGGGNAGNGGVATGGDVNADGGDAGAVDGGPSATIDGVFGGAGSADTPGQAPGGGGGNAAIGAPGRITFTWSAVGTLYTAADFADVTEPADSPFVSPLDSAVGFGRLWFTGRGVFPFSLVYDRATGSFSTQAVGEQTALYPTGHASFRDTVLMDSGLLNNAQPNSSTINAQHLYNLLNAGWTATAIDAYYAAHARYPAVSQQYFLARNATSDFDATKLAKLEFGDGESPRGRLLVNILREQRHNVVTHTAVSAGAPASPLAVGADKDSTSGHGMKTCAFAHGRLWLAGDSKPRNHSGVYFSRVIKNAPDAGKFYSTQDPTSEEFPDPLDTDGGAIFIAEAGGIEKLVPFQRGVLVLAKRGVWYIHGDQAGFRATSFSVDKLSSHGCLGTTTVAFSDDAVFYLGEAGVYAVAVAENVALPVVRNISEQRIQTLYRAVPRRAWELARGLFDPVSRTVIWLYLDDDGVDYEALSQTYNRCLLLNTRTGAFRPYSFPYASGSGYYGVKGAGVRYSQLPSKRLDEVVDSNHVHIVDSAGSVVTTFEDEEETYALNVKLIVGYHVDETSNAVVLCDLTDYNFVDFAGLPIGPVDYSSYIITGDETLDVIAATKQAPYVTSYFKRTEAKWESDGDDTPAVVLDRRSGCLMTAQWDWHRDSTGNRWSVPQQAYRFRVPLPAAPVSLDDTPLDVGASINYSKLKARGKGKALAVRYESESGKDFRLQGFNVRYAVDA